MTSGPRPTRRGRALRPAVATAEIVVLGLAAHAGAGGTVPSPDLLLALVALVGAVSGALHLRLLRLPVAAFLTIAAQAALHTAGSPPPTPHAHHSAVTTPDEHMLLAHAVSGLVTVLALVWQEQVLGALVRALVPLRPAAVASGLQGLRPLANQWIPHLLGGRSSPASPRGPPLLRALVS